MSIIGVFSGTFCNDEPVMRELHRQTGYKMVSDQEMVHKASELCGLSESKIERAFTAKTSVFNNFTHEKERSIAHLKLAVAQQLLEDEVIFNGFCCHLIPSKVTHALRVCLIADLKFRKETAEKEMGISEKDALALIRKQDEDRAAWVLDCRGKKDPWDATLYDMVIPMDKSEVEKVVSDMGSNIKSDLLKPSESSRKAAQDFLLSASVGAALTREGHNAAVEAEEGAVTIIINKHVLMLSRLEEELKSIASRLPGVVSVSTKVGKDYYKADIYRKFDFEAPSKVLLVDDEREFVQTLSERLLMRDMGSAVAYDGGVGPQTGE